MLSAGRGALLPLLFPTTPQQHLVVCIAGGVSPTVLRVFPGRITGFSLASVPSVVCPPGRCWDEVSFQRSHLGTVKTRIFCMILEGVRAVFMLHPDLENPHPKRRSMSRFFFRCHHVPSIGCDGQWKQHHHCPRRELGQPPRGGEKTCFATCSQFY